MKTFKESLAEFMQDTEFREEWDALEPKRQITKTILEGRIVNHLTQEQLAAATGINQADISRLEDGTDNPSLRTLKRLAAGMGVTLKLEFIPNAKSQFEQTKMSRPMPCRHEAGHSKYVIGF